MLAKEAIEAIAEEQWKPFYDRDGTKTDRGLPEPVHTMEKAEAFRLIVMRGTNLQRNLLVREDYCYHCIVTNSGVSSQEVVWTHNDRGQMENYIKDPRRGFGMEQMPSGDFFANALYFALGVLAYNTTVA